MNQFTCFAHLALASQQGSAACLGLVQAACAGVRWGFGRKAHVACQRSFGFFVLAADDGICTLSLYSRDFLMFTRWSF